MFKKAYSGGLYTLYTCIIRYVNTLVLISKVLDRYIFSMGSNGEIIIPQEDSLSIENDLQDGYLTTYLSNTLSPPPPPSDLSCPGIVDHMGPIYT